MHQCCLKTSGRGFWYMGASVWLNIMIIYFVLICSLIRASYGETSGPVQRLHDLQHDGTVIHMGKRYNNGNVLTSVVTLGIQMCVNVCLKTSGCGLVNFDTRELLCEMIKADDSVNAAYLVNSQWDILASVSSSSNVSWLTLTHCLSFLLPNYRSIFTSYRSFNI